MSKLKEFSGLPLGGSFLLEPFGTRDLFIPEEASEEERSLAQLTNDFSRNEVLPQSDAIEEAKPGVVATLLKKAGELGLLMAEVPTEFGGLGLGKTSTTFISENSTHQGSFTTAFMCHTGIATLPVLAFGTPEQKKKYLTKLATGEMLGAYSLTEPGAGSDALAGKAKAILSNDGKHYLLNGEKIFVTNGGFADLFTLFAKIDGEHFTGFLVERNFPGVTIGPEEKKMGIHGSSTVSVWLKDAQVPVENVLGEIGKGHRIAFNVLNVGRWKLGAACLGGCKRLIERTVPYIKERQQFGKSISDFELIREKLATMGILTYFVESLVYRYAHMVDEAMKKVDHPTVLKEYAVEASIAKVFGSEALQRVADDAVQMFGGYGYCKDYVVERFYRDCRINRIFEGTNEINELLITGNIVKRAMKREIPLMDRLQEILAQLTSGFPSLDAHQPLAQEINGVESLKRLAIYTAGVALQKYMQDFENQQVVSAFIADVMIEAFALESGLLRACKIRKAFGEEKAKIPEAMCRVAVAEHVGSLFARAHQVLMNIADGDEKTFEPYAKALARLTPKIVTNTLRDRATIATRLLEKEGFVL